MLGNVDFVFISVCDFQIVWLVSENSCYFFLNQYYFKINFVLKYLGWQKSCEDGTRRVLEYLNTVFSLINVLPFFGSFFTVSEQIGTHYQVKSALYSNFLSSYLIFFVVVVQSLSHVWLFETPWAAARPASLSFILVLF